MYLLFTTPTCGKCKMIKNFLIQKDVPFTEVNIVESKENLELAQKYNISVAGTIINSETGQQVNLEDI